MKNISKKIVWSAFFALLGAAQLLTAEVNAGPCDEFTTKYQDVHDKLMGLDDKKIDELIDEKVQNDPNLQKNPNKDKIIAEMKMRIKLYRGGALEFWNNLLTYKGPQRCAGAIDRVLRDAEKIENELSKHNWLLHEQ